MQNYFDHGTDMTPEEQYITLMDAAYNAPDKESYYKFMQKADNILMQQTKQVLQNKKRPHQSPHRNFRPTVHQRQPISANPFTTLSQIRRRDSNKQMTFSEELLQLLLQYNDFTQRGTQ